MRRRNVANGLWIGFAACTPAVSVTAPEPVVEHDRRLLPAGRVEVRDGGVWLDVPSNQEILLGQQWLESYPRLLPVASEPEAAAAISSSTLLDAVPLPPLSTEDERSAPGPFLAVLSLHCADPRQDHLCLDLIARGRNLALGYGDAERLLPTFGFALPSDAVLLTRTTVAGLPAWRVRVDLPVPWQPWPQCWVGQLLIHVDDPRGDDQRTAESRSYLEFGKCE